MPVDQLIPAEEALKIVLADAEPGGTEILSLSDAANLVLAEDLGSKRTQPPFDASAMDGFAVKANDVSKCPVTLRIVGESKAGTPFKGILSSGEAVRIFTGAVVPPGADAIVIQENTHIKSDVVEVLNGAPEGKFIRKAGLDFKKGETLLFRGDVLTPNRLALAASMNFDRVNVFRRPKLAIIATGDEIVMPGTDLSDGQIIASNTFGVAAAAKGAGAEVLDLGIAPDQRTLLREKMKHAIDSGVDIIVTTGGASVGDHDIVRPVAAELGFQFEITKIAMRPGKPFLFAKQKRDRTSIYLVGLAGNPVSSLIAFNVFVKPLIGRLIGKPDQDVQPLPAILGCDLPPNDERMEYMRAVTTISENGTRVTTPFTAQDSSMLANLVRANSLMIRPVKAEAARKGDTCEIILLD